MCWSICGGLPKLLTAEEDIPVLKVGLDRDKQMQSPYRGFKYELGKTYSMEEPLHLKGTSWYSYVNEGFHSYDSSKVTIRNEYWTLLVYKGRHTVVGQYTSDMSTFNAKVPKGAHYYINELGEIVSDQIIIICKI